MNTGRRITKIPQNRNQSVKIFAPNPINRFLIPSGVKPQNRDTLFHGAAPSTACARFRN